ncbi:MAG: hypothetical protein AB1635_11730 [Acidobacteriota bacterium]
MRPAAALLLVAWPLAAAATPADLARARTAYNQRQFDVAIEAATAARRTPATADAAAVVLARAHLERYRERVDPADLAAARTALGAVRADVLGARDRVEYLLALGQALFLEDDFGAAARVLESAVEVAAGGDPRLREAALDWWGSAVERHAAGVPADARRDAFARLGDRMARELAREPGLAAAAYWVAAAARGEGQAAQAWDAAIAGWVRARLAGDRAAALRADLDRLVREGIIPDRVARLAPEARARAEADLRAEWALVKERWR